MTMHRYITVRGTKLAYLEYGDRDPLQATILILHGLVAEAETFKLVAEELLPRHIIALEMPGNGLSERAAEMSFLALSETVKEFAAALGLHRPVLLGHSHGGAVALQLAANDSAWPSALVLLCPAHPFSRKEDVLVRFYLSRAGRLFALSIPKMPSWMHLAAFQRMPGRRDHLGEAELAPYLRSLRRPEMVENTLILLSSWHKDMRCLRDDLERKRPDTRTLLLWGELDVVVPPSTAARLLEQLPRAEMVLFPGVGHLPNDEAPVECAAMILAWLAGQEDR